MHLGDMVVKQRLKSITSCKAGVEALCGVAVGFRLRQRALHVYSEKERVPLFKQICDGAAPAEEKTEQLARLMNDSQASCRCLISPRDPATHSRQHGNCRCNAGQKQTCADSAVTHEDDA